MPQYVYRCENGHRVTVRRSPERADDPIACPQCGHRAVRLQQVRGLERAPGPERYRKRHGRD